MDDRPSSPADAAQRRRMPHGFKRFEARQQDRAERERGG